MKIKFYFSLLAALVVAALVATASAYDFTVEPLCYKITSNNPPTAMVTYEKYYADNVGTKRYSELNGTIDIPERVSYNGKTYTVTAIDDNALRTCQNVLSVSIPATVTSIGKHAFQSCKGITTLVFLEPSDGSDPQPLTIGEQAFYYCTALPSVTLPRRVSSIGNSAFYNCYAITSFNFLEPSNLTSIGEKAFTYCSRIQSIDLPNSITSIGANAFQQSGLTSIRFPENLTTISSNMCNTCNSLRQITIPEGVTTIETNAFRGAGGYNSNQVEIPAGEEVVVELPSTLKTIGREAFCCMSNLKTITIPSSVETIEDGAFSSCRGLTSVNIQNAVIGNGQFSGVWSLKSLTIPSSVKTIGNSSFAGCRELEKVTIEADLTSYGTDVFSGCDKLKTLIIKSNTFKISMFPRFSSSYTLFAEQLTTATYDGVTTIAEGSLEGCTAMEKITIPATVKKIENSAFKGCTVLRDFYSLLERPLVIDASVFEDVPVTGYCDLHVPQGSEVRYRAMNVWKDFTIINEDAGHGSSRLNEYDVNADGNVDVGDVNSVLNYILEHN